MQKLQPQFTKFTPLEYLKIDIASNFGLDKAEWDVRLTWFEAHKDNLLSQLKYAKEPALYFAGVQAYNDALAGKPSGYTVSLDGTSSGLQILTCLTGDRLGASICNVVNRMYTEGVNAGVPERADAYTIVYHTMLDAIGESGKISRDDSKKAVMTSLYGSEAVPKEVFGDGPLLNVFLETMNALAPAAWELNQAFLKLWNPDAFSHDWVLPDNFHVKTKVMSRVKETVHFLNEPFETFYDVNQPTEEGRALGANTTHSIDGYIVREVVRRCNFDANRIREAQYIVKHGIGVTGTKEDADMVAILWGHYKKSGMLSARILDHIYEDNLHLVDRDVVQELIDSLPVKSFQVMTIHDCFRCLPAYANDLRAQYNIQLYHIAKSNLLSYILTQLVGKEMNIGKMDPEMYKDVLHTEYALS